jgi:hypothetical protein
MQKLPTLHAAWLVRVVLLPPIATLPALTASGAALPAGQYTLALPHCCCVDDVDPAGHTKPAVHAPVHDALTLPVALPKRPAGHEIRLPEMQ